MATMRDFNRQIDPKKLPKRAAAKPAAMDTVVVRNPGQAIAAQP